MYSIYPFQITDLDAYRRMRLEALQTEAGSFGNSYALRQPSARNNGLNASIILTVVVLACTRAMSWSALPALYPARSSLQRPIWPNHTSAGSTGVKACRVCCMQRAWHGPGKGVYPASLSVTASRILYRVRPINILDLPTPTGKTGCGLMGFRNRCCITSWCYNAGIKARASQLRSSCDSVGTNLEPAYLYLKKFFLLTTKFYFSWFYTYLSIKTTSQFEHIEKFK